MKVICTLDFIDGAKSKHKTVEVDEINTHFLLMHLLEPGVASMTFTRADLLKRLATLEEPKP